MDIIDNLSKCIEEYNGKKLVFIVTGGAMEVFRLPQTPGASKVLQAMFVPYGEKELEKFVASCYGLEGGEKVKKAVSPETANMLCKTGLQKWKSSKVVAVTAATTTSRWRRGTNHAFVAVGEISDGIGLKTIRVHHLELPKLSKEEYEKLSAQEVLELRIHEDKEIANFALKLAFGDIEEEYVQ
jgi:nicotinamide mononucleotide (NMN) deamidase PncC